jgi:hypothetical protein
VRPERPAARRPQSATGNRQPQNTHVR